MQLWVFCRRAVPLKMLDHTTSPGDVQNLAAAADAKYRQVDGQCLPGKTQFQFVSTYIYCVRVCSGELRSKIAGMYVSTSGQDQAIQMLEYLVRQAPVVVRLKYLPRRQSGGRVRSEYDRRNIKACQDIQIVLCIPLDPFWIAPTGRHAHNQFTICPKRTHPGLQSCSSVAPRTNAAAT